MRDLFVGSHLLPRSAAILSRVISACVLSDLTVPVSSLSFCICNRAICCVSFSNAADSAVQHFKSVKSVISATARESCNSLSRLSALLAAAILLSICALSHATDPYSSPNAISGSTFATVTGVAIGAGSVQCPHDLVRPRLMLFSSGSNMRPQSHCTRARACPCLFLPECSVRIFILADGVQYPSRL